jgi:hypothetical protein
MPWAVAVQRRDDGKVQLLTNELLDYINLDYDSSEFEDDVHVVPCTVVPVGEDEDIKFGSHDFTRKCYCEPVLKPGSFEKTLVVHREAN